MTLKPLSIVAVGRLKTPFWKDAAAHYAARLKRWRALREIVIKDGDASLPRDERNALEGRNIFAALTPADIVVCLDERGAGRTSQDFAAFLARLSENANRTPCFVIGGAFGLSDAVRQAAQHTLCLGPMTLPHELARVVLLEQLYRAEAILRNVPYHHA